MLSSDLAPQIMKMLSATMQTSLAKVQEKTKDRLLIVPRVYTNKPRTTGEGYMGMLHQPDPEKTGYASGNYFHPSYAHEGIP